MPSAARPKSRPLDLETDEFNFEALDGLPVPEDPAIVATLLLLNRALSALGTSLGDAGGMGRFTWSLRRPPGRRSSATPGRPSPAAVNATPTAPSSVRGATPLG